MALETFPFDTAKFLSDEADQIELLQDALKSGSVETITSALGLIGRARGMAKLAAESGVALYEALSPRGDPRLSTLLKVTGALGLEMTAPPTRNAKLRPVRKVKGPEGRGGTVSKAT